MRLQFLHQSTEERRKLILSGSIPRILLLLSVPTLLMSVVQSLLPLSDGLIVNNMAGTLVASAVTYSEPLVNVMVGVAQGTGVAAMALIGQSAGRGDLIRARKIAVQTAAFGLLAGLIAIPVLVGLAFPIAAHVTPEISGNVFLYIALYALVMPFAFFQAIFNAIENATGRPEETFLPMLLLLLFKIGFNGVFVVWLRLEVVGCVLASLCANGLICGWMFYRLFLRKGPDRLELRGFRPDREIVSALVSLGIPSMLSSMMINLGIFLINMDIQKYGAVALNGAGIASNITAICFCLPAAFGAAVTTMVSMNLGAGQEKNARRATRFACVLSLLTAGVMAAVLLPLSGPLTELFTRSEPVLEVARPALNLYAFSIFGFGVCQVELGAFVGMGRTRVPLIISVLRIWLIRMIFIWFTEPALGVLSVFWGNLFSNSLAPVIAGAILLRVQWRALLLR